MSKELSIRLNSTSYAAGRLAAGLRTAGIVVAGSAFVAICAHIALPLNFTPVPLNLQTFAVLVLGLLLSPRLAAGTLAAYLAEGAMGLPVFSPFPVIPGGMAHLMGPTGGYLLSYPLAVAIIAYLWRTTGLRRERGTEVSDMRRSFAGAAGSAAVGTLFILGCGALWLSVWTHASVQAILSLSVIPFLPGEALKIAAAAGVAIGYYRLRHRAS